MPPAPCQQPSVVCHDNLKGEHILIASAGDAITGIIDWSDLSLADPATDFAGLIIWLGGSFVATVLRRYTLESDGQILARARFLARANALYLIGERLAGESDAPLDLLGIRGGHWLGWPHGPAPLHDAHGSDTVRAILLDGYRCPCF
jgi:hypothetical protein